MWILAEFPDLNLGDTIKESLRSSPAFAIYNLLLHERSRLHTINYDVEQKFRPEFSGYLMVSYAVGKKNINGKDIYYFSTQLLPEDNTPTNYFATTQENIKSIRLTQRIKYI